MCSAHLPNTLKRALVKPMTQGPGFRLTILHSSAWMEPSRRPWLGTERSRN